MGGTRPGLAAADAVVGPLPLRTSVGTKSPAPTWPKPAWTIHVSPRGSDSGNGTPSQPFATLERARDEIRAHRTSGVLPDGGVEVQIHGGEYAVTQTLELTARDSGTEATPVVYRAAAGEKPIWRGGARVTGWQPLSEAQAYPLLPAEARGKVWVADLRAAGVTNVLPLVLGGFSSGRGFKTHPAHELFFNGEALTLSRGPNEGFLHVAGVEVKDGTKGYDREGSKIGRLLFDGDRPRRWAKEPDLLLYGYWFWDWADSYERVASIDPAKRLIVLAEPWHTYGFSVGAPYYALNALSELDAPGEWYLDRATGQLLLYPPSDPRQATIEISQFAAPMLHLKEVSWVSFVGLTWELGSADAIHVDGGAHCLLAGCVVRRFAGNGIEIRGGEQHRLLSCDVYSLGRGGVTLAGGSRKTLAPGGHGVENCDIHDLSRIDHTYTPAVLVDGVGHRLAHNRLHDVRSSALRVGGNEHVFEYNEIYNAVTESDDQGGADMWGNPTFRGDVYRYNYWHHIGNWRAVGDQPKCGQAAIRLDDAICGTTIVGNVFERCSAGKLGFGGVQIHGGKDNVIENNLFLECAAMISCSPWDGGRWREFVKAALDQPEIDRDLYLKRYPALAQLTENANVNRIRRNLAWRCGELLRRAPGNLDAGDNVVLTDAEFLWTPLHAMPMRTGFEPIPFQEIGLYADAWRRGK